MSEFHDTYPDYERMAHHDEAAGKKIRRTLWNVFWLLLGVTIFEVIVGLYASGWGLSKTILKVTFISLTIVKAAYIVMVFMHLKDESKWTKWVILTPYTFFILYLFFMMTVVEGNYALEHRLNGPGKTEHVEATHSAGEHH